MNKIRVSVIHLAALLALALAGCTTVRPVIESETRRPLDNEGNNPESLATLTSPATQTSAPMTASPGVPAVTITPTASETPVPPGATPTPQPPSATATLPPPVVMILAPASPITVAPGQPIEVNSSSSSPGGIARVELWADGALYTQAVNLISGQTSIGVIQTWTSLTPGSHALAVMAVDVNGQYSRPAALQVFIAEAAGPKAWFVQPGSGAVSVSASQAVMLEYYASAPAGALRVELWADGLLVDSTPSPQGSNLMHLQRSWKSNTAGIHDLFIRAFDLQNRWADSEHISIQVQASAPPRASIDAPADGTQVAYGQDVNVVISSRDRLGVTNMELWVDNQVYATWNSRAQDGDPQARVSVLWRSPARGTHTLVLWAVNAQGLSGASKPVSVMVSGAPTPAPANTPLPPAPTVMPPPTPNQPTPGAPYGVETPGHGRREIP